MQRDKILVQILGAGCAKCEKLAENAEAAVRESAAWATVEKVRDIDRIMSFGVMMTPALVVDGRVKAVGRIPSVEEIKQLLAS